MRVLTSVVTTLLLSLLSDSHEARVSDQESHEYPFVFAQNPVFRPLPSSRKPSCF